MAKRSVDWVAVRLAAIGVIGVAGAVIGLFFALNLTPPERLILAAGPADGAYYAIAERYRAILAEDGLDLEILETAGSVENADALADGRADAALLQGGVTPPADADVEALAAIFLEPMSVFVSPASAEPFDPSALEGVRVAIGPPGSGTRAAVEAAARALRIDLPASAKGDLGGQDAADALLAGTIDAAVFVAPLDAPYLTGLLTAPSVGLAPLRDLAAVERRLPWLRVATFPAGIYDYARRIPAEPMQLPAMVAALAARDDLHPALVNRLVTAAIRIHSAPGLLQDQGDFPNPNGLALPMNAQAETLLREGPPAFENLLPYWASAQINRIAILLLPFLLLLLPLARILPGIYAWRIGGRIWRRYEALADIEEAIASTQTPEGLSTLETELESLDEGARALVLPQRYRAYAYALRTHIDHVRRALRERKNDLAGDAPTLGG